MKSPKLIFDELVRKALGRTIIGYPDEMRLEHARRDGKPIPDICKPGALLNTLTADEREALTHLTSDMTKNDRIRYV